MKYNLIGTLSYLLLTVIGIVTVSSNSKKGNASAIYMSDGIGVCVPIATGLSNSLFTTIGTCQATISTSGCTYLRRLWTTSTCTTKKLYVQ